MAAACALHNFLTQDTSPAEQFYCPPGYGDQVNAAGQIIDGDWRKDKDSPTLIKLEATDAKNASEMAKATRALYKDYFMSPAGEVPWQYDCPGVSEKCRKSKKGCQA